MSEANIHPTEMAETSLNVSGEVYDVIIIGGGVNGTGVARDAALRGLRVCLLEKGDLGGATSSASTKLIHGGLRYLEFGAFRLVQDALFERQLLMKMMPGFIREMRFVLPFKKRLKTARGKGEKVVTRPFVLVRLGLWLYDLLGPRGVLKKSTTIPQPENSYTSLLKDGMARGFEYSDCIVDDARLVIFNALEAAAAGAVISSYSTVVSAVRGEKYWQVELEDGRLIEGRSLVNATGPYVNRFIETEMKKFAALPLRLVRGSHIVVPRLYELERAFLLQQDDGRVVFTIPYERHFTLIGTTEEPQETDLETVSATESEIAYLMKAVAQYFRRDLKRSDVVWSFAGVRPLYDEGKTQAYKANRDYKLDVEVVEEHADGLPVVHIYGGKITTFRKLSADVVDKLKVAFPELGPCRTDVVPYTAFDDVGYKAWLKDFHERFVLLPLSMKQRWLHAYGRRVEWFLKGVRSKKDLGQDFGAGFFERELRYLITHEWARTPEDVLWRRTKLGLHLSESQREAVSSWMKERQQSQFDEAD